MNPIRKVVPPIGAILWIILSVGTAFSAEVVQEFTARVARISSIEGPVTIQRTVDEDWTHASLNLPLMVGDKIFTGLGGRVELQLDDETVIRLDSDSYIHFANLEDSLTRIGILKGVVSVYADKVPYQRAPIEVQTGSFIAQIKEQGKIRFNVQENGDAQILARRGEVLVTPGNQPYQLQRGDQLRVSPVKTGFETINQEDPFDQWCDMRDAMSATSVSREQVTTRVAGYSDLDRYGTWTEIPDYGRVWRPAVTVVDWAPYREGRWVWYDSCGWTWVSSEPWGWVPYHYGRWVYVRNHNWCWVPHREVVHVVHHYSRPVWYPALVSFSYARRGSFFSFSIGGGGYYNDPCIGWFALGPRDPFVPWHRGHHRHHGYRDFGGPGRHDGRAPQNSLDRSGNRITAGGDVYIDNSTHIYQNQDAPNAMTVVGEREFTRGEYEDRAVANVTSSRGGEVAVGSNAIQQLETKRILDTKPTREAGRSTDSAVAAKAPTNPAGVSPQRSNQPGAEQPGRSVSPQRNTATEPRTSATSAKPEAGRVQTNEALRNTQAPAGTPTRAARTSEGNAGASRETKPVRTNTNASTRNSAESAVPRSVIQDVPRTTAKEPVRSNASATQSERSTSESRTPISNPNRVETSTEARTNSPMRSTQNVRGNATSGAAVRDSVIQDRTRSTSNAKTFSTQSNQPAQQSPSRQSIQPTNQGNRSASRSVSQPRLSTQSSTQSAPVRNYSPSRTYTQPWSNVQQSSPAQSYSPSRSTSQSYSVPQNSSASRSYSAPQNSQSYSAPRSGNTSVERSSSSSSGRSSGTSAGRTSPPR